MSPPSTPWRGTATLRFLLRQDPSPQQATTIVRGGATAPLKLQRGFVVYSIGKDGQDNGGKEGPPHSEREDTPAGQDITFIVER